MIRVVDSGDAAAILPSCGNQSNVYPVTRFEFDPDQTTLTKVAVAVTVTGPASQVRHFI